MNAQQATKDRTGVELVASVASPANTALTLVGSIVIILLATGVVPGTQHMWSPDEPGVPKVMLFMGILGVLCSAPMLFLHYSRARIVSTTLRNGLTLKAEILQLQRAISQDLLQQDLFHVRFRYTAPNGDIITRQTGAMDWSKVMHLSRGNQIDIKVDPNQPELGFWVGER